ncbi:MAG: 50S ribosomal protein L9 [Aphanocapsa lilacina HA4352-LM1]|jgi:large subunit ribosomal protein L9|nr:50S ribosomal protein L9 [Aphanocapsa lilacina HA4352-LM1]
MGTKIVLKKDVDTLGKAGTLVEVAPGYARNYLIPQGLAVKATPGLVKEAEFRQAKRREIEAKQRADALETKKTLEALGFYEVFAPVGEDGNQLFGTVTNQDVAEVVASKAGITIDRREITIEEPIKRTGVYTVKARIFQDVVATLRLQVNAAG